MLESTDVLIAGGGPGGLAAARAIAETGARVAVFEKNGEIGSPTRTSGGSFIQDLQEFAIPRELYHPIHVCRWFSPNNQATFAQNEPAACVIDVRGVYQFLAERAIAAGTVVIPAATVTELLFSGKTVSGARVRNARGVESDVRAKLVIDATGHRGALLKQAGIIAGSQRFGVGAEYDLYAPHFDEREVVLIVGSRVAPSGYAWAFPWGRHRVRLGVGVIHPDSAEQPSGYLDRLLQNGSAFGMNLRGAQPVEYHTGLIPSDGPYERFAGDGILGVGDAAGQPSALLGEGIRWAMHGGRLAGEVAAEALRADDTSAKFLSTYEKRWRQRFGMNLRIAYEINKRIARWTDAQWDDKTELLKLLTPDEFMNALRTELAGPWLLHVVRRHPRLIRAGALSVLRAARG